MPGGIYPVIPLTYNLIILRRLPFTQAITITDYSSTTAATWEEAFDRACMIEQQLQEQLNRSFLQDVTQTTQLTFPIPEALYLIGWNSAGTGLENKYPINPNDVAAAAASASAASGYASAASASAAAAAASAASIPALSTDVTLGGGSPSDAKIPSQKAVKTYVDNSPAGDMKYTDTRFKSGQFTRDLSQGAGTQQITGFAKAPNLVILFGGCTNHCISIGFDDLSNPVDGGAYTPGTTNFVFNSGHSQQYLEAPTTSDKITCKVTATDASSFTVTWANVEGSPSGTAYVNYIVFY